MKQTVFFNLVYCLAAIAGLTLLQSTVSPSAIRNGLSLQNAERGSTRLFTGWFKRTGTGVWKPSATSHAKQDFLSHYEGKPWNNQLMQIPGRIQCEWYDLGGEGVAYHDQDSVNNGSGKLNPANGTFLNEFRMKEGVDISYTKSKDIDNSPYNLVQPLMDQFYAGWTVPGEWINYTIHVNRKGAYIMGLMYTASGEGAIALLLDGKKISNEILIPSTRNDKETIPWRQWHHWNRIDSLTTVLLKRGVHVLTLQTVKNGNMNYDYLEFTKSR